jgi:hypothetical protein
MSRQKTSSRQLKKKIQKLLLQQDLESGLAEIGRMPARKAINPLFSFLCNLDKLLKWRAVTAMGEVVDRLADTDMESARVIMRRYMWQLNDESGGIGWGCPEAMGEIMARNENLAGEFWCILISYIRPDGNFCSPATGRSMGGRPACACPTAAFKIFGRLPAPLHADRRSVSARTGSLGSGGTAK